MVTENPKVFDVTLTTATDAQHAGDVLAATQEIANFFPSANIPAQITGIVVTDADDQGGQIDILFMNAATDIGAEGAANDITDAEGLTILGWVDVNAATFQSDWGNFRTAVVKPSDTVFYVPKWIQGASTSLYIAAIDRSGSTYASGGINVKISVEYP